MLLQRAVIFASIVTFFTLVRFLPGVYPHVSLKGFTVAGFVRADVTAIRFLPRMCPQVFGEVASPVEDLSALRTHKAGFCSRLWVLAGFIWSIILGVAGGS